MKSQFNHSSRFTSPFFNFMVYIYMCMCVCANVCVFSFSLFSLFLLFPRYFFPAQSRARARFACRRSEIVTTYNSVRNAFVKFFRSEPHARNRAQQPRNKICNRKSGYIASRLISLVRMEEPRLGVVPTGAPTHPSTQRVRRSRGRGPAGPDPPRLFYNLYKKINAFLNTHNNRIVQNDFCAYFPSSTELVSLFISLFVQNMSLCAQHSSRPFAERSLRKLLPPLFYSFFFFGTIFEMHSQLSSANLFALAFAELQDHAGSPGGTRLPHYRRLLKLPRTMPECYSSSLSLSPVLFLFFWGFFLYLFWFCSHVVFVSLA